MCLSTEVETESLKRYLNEDIFNMEIAALKWPLTTLLKKMWSNIKRQEYAALIGDDFSGRIPALVLGHVINTINRQNSWLPLPVILFEGRADYADIPENKKVQLQEKALATRALKKKVLVVTDFISSGNTIRSFGRVLTECNASFDVAAVSIGCADQPRPALDFGDNVRVFDGEEIGAPGIYRQYSLAGIEGVPGNRDPFLGAAGTAIAKQDMGNLTKYLVELCNMNLVSRFEVSPEELLVRI